MKPRLLVALIALAMVLSVAGIVTAAPSAPFGPLAPDSITSYSVSPNTGPVGATLTFAVAFDSVVDTTSYAVCFYFKTADEPAWATNFPATQTSSLAGVTYTKDATATNDCPTVAGYQSFYYYTSADAGNGAFGDTITFNAVIPALTAEGKITAIRLYSGTACQDTDGTGGTTGPGGSSCNSDALTRTTTFTVQALGSQIYVANDATGCGSNSPCLTGGTALNTALDNVTGPGDVFVLGDYLMSPGVTADLNTAKTVTVSGVGGASLNMAAGTCSGAALVNNGGTLTVQNLAIDGTCASGSRSAAVRNDAGTLSVKNATVRDFAGAGIGVAAAGGTVVVEGSNFNNNNVALDGAGGTLYAFANNVNTNTSLNAAANIGGDNVKCNYWNSYNITGDATQYEERLGAPVSTYIEGAGALTLGRADLSAGTDNRVIVNMGRSTPPFNNGTVLGLGAQTSDFFAFCLARNGSALGTVTVTSDAVAAGATGHRLYRIDDTTECSPSTNMACWDHTGATSAGGAVSAVLVPTVSSEGQYVIGNQVDPTAVTLRDLNATPIVTPWPLILAAVVVLGALLALGMTLRRRAIKA
ncbi:MAG: hypothetical protein HY870_05390 [Chloroflexi bacterium]|nr:hypothetical protein [Chloroflexota bacterium]